MPSIVIVHSTAIALSPNKATLMDYASLTTRIDPREITGLRVEAGGGWPGPIPPVGDVVVVQYVTDLGSASNGEHKFEW
ncbi:hypothetical protein N8D56_27195 (plasmid) [Devosia sp. A8/3-2]|nr:hypothetical protein N8D56_27195 [Devosia sp. A8/3-2]